MPNILTKNPMVIDTAATIWTAARYVRLIQLVDNNGDIIHDTTWVITVNGATLTIKIQPVNDQVAFGAVAWQIGPFNPGMLIHTFVVGTAGAGNLHVWLD